MVSSFLTGIWAKDLLERAINWDSLIKRVLVAIALFLIFLLGSPILLVGSFVFARLWKIWDWVDGTLCIGVWIKYYREGESTLHRDDNMIYCLVKKDLLYGGLHPNWFQAPYIAKLKEHNKEKWEKFEAEIKSDFNL